jgi:hypothetical protein
MDVPDHIWLVDTQTAPPSVVIAKEGSRTEVDIRKRYFPFSLRPRDA